jgi:putative membrane protein
MYSDNKKMDPAKLATLEKVAYVIAAVVFALVIFMRGDFKPDLGIDFTFVPKLNAVLNSGVAVLLIAAIYFIKKKNISAHRYSIYGAMALSFFFLIFYVLYHFTNHETPYCGEGAMKTFYYIILISHILLAGISLPFILITFVRGYGMDVDRHKSIAKKVFPIWLYVAITGPLVYLLLSPCYPF